MMFYLGGFLHLKIMFTDGIGSGTAGRLSLVECIAGLAPDYV
jgi:hypothetical protein